MASVDVRRHPLLAGQIVQHPQQGASSHRPRAFRVYSWSPIWTTMTRSPAAQARCATVYAPDGVLVSMPAFRLTLPPHRMQIPG
jgi:hypothetical protein